MFNTNDKTYFCFTMVNDTSHYVLNKPLHAWQFLVGKRST